MAVLVSVHSIEGYVCGFLNCVVSIFVRLAIFSYSFHGVLKYAKYLQSEVREVNCAVSISGTILTTLVSKLRICEL